MVCYNCGEDSSHFCLACSRLVCSYCAYLKATSLGPRAICFRHDLLNNQGYWDSWIISYFALELECPILVMQSLFSNRPFRYYSFDNDTWQRMKQRSRDRSPMRKKKPIKMDIEEDGSVRELVLHPVKKLKLQFLQDEKLVSVKTRIGSNSEKKWIEVDLTPFGGEVLPPIAESPLSVPNEILFFRAMMMLETPLNFEFDDQKERFEKFKTMWENTKKEDGSITFCVSPIGGGVFLLLNDLYSKIKQ